MAVLKKAELEKQIQEAIEKATKLMCEVKAVDQIIGTITTVRFAVTVGIKGRVEDLKVRRFIVME